MFSQEFQGHPGSRAGLLSYCISIRQLLWEQKIHLLQGIDAIG